MNEIQKIKWTLELCNQEGYNKPSEIDKAYEIEILGC